MDLTIKLSKNFNEVLKNLQTLSGRLEKVKTTIGTEIAEQGRNIIVTHIEKQDLPWHALSERWLRFKKNNGLAEKIYIATGEFISKIEIKQVKPGVWRVGAFKSTRHNASGLNMAKLARILEYGAPEVGIPARPLFRPSQAELKRFIRAYLGVAKKKVRELVTVRKH